MPLSGRGGARATLDRKKYAAGAVRSNGGLCVRRRQQIG